MFTGVPTVYGINPHETSTTPLHDIGTMGLTNDGRAYRYVEASGGADLDPGGLCIAADIIANHDDIECNTFAIGDTVITVTLLGTAVVAGEYVGGYLSVIDEAGQGIMYKIQAHDASAAGGEDITVTLKEPIRVAAAAATTVTLVKNKYKDIVVSDGTQTDLPVGVPNVTITLDEFGWVQTKGMCSILVGAAVPTVGNEITIGDTAAGSVDVRATLDVVVGTCPAGIASDAGEYGVFDLRLD